MSQYPPGYPSQLGYPQAPMADPLAPAKRASIMMIVVGCLALVLGLCVGFAAMMLTGPMEAQFSRQMPPGISPQMVGLVLKVIFGVFLVVALVEVILGILIRSGKSTPIVISIVLTVLGIFYFIFNLVVIVHGGNPTQIIVAGITVMIVVAQLLFLIPAMKASQQVQSMQAAYQAQYWHYMQQQQAYQQGTAAPPGYGGTPAYGANAYNAPPLGAAGTAPAQSGWQWTGQPTSPPLPPPPLSIPLPPPPNDVDHDKRA